MLAALTSCSSVVCCHWSSVSRLLGLRSVSALTRYPCCTRIVRRRHGIRPERCTDDSAARSAGCAMSNDQICDPRVRATPEAVELIERLVEKHGPVAFFQSGGCCDGTATNCLTSGGAAAERRRDQARRGRRGAVYVNTEAYRRWGRPDFVIDVAAGAAGAFALEGLEEVHFVSRSPADSLKSCLDPRLTDGTRVSGAAVGQREGEVPGRDHARRAVLCRAAPRSGGRCRARPSASPPPRATRST